METLHGELKNRRVYINRDMEEKMPMMAGAVYSEEKMQLILMLWGIPWERMTLGEATTPEDIRAAVEAVEENVRMLRDSI